MVTLCILLAPVALANLLTLYVAWRRYMSTPTPVPAAPSFWSAFGAALEHTLIADGIAPLRAGLAAFKAAKADPVKITLVLAQQQVALAQVAPTLAADIEGDVVDAMDALLAKAQASAPAAPATPAS